MKKNRIVIICIIVSFILSSCSPKGSMGENPGIVTTGGSPWIDSDIKENITAGMEPVLETVDKIESINDMDDLTEFLCDTDNRFYTPWIISIGNYVSDVDSSKYVTTVELGNLVLMDAAEYKERSQLGDLFYEAMLSLSEAMMTKLGYTEDEAKQEFDRLLEFEGMIASAAYTNDEKFQPDHVDKIQNYYTMDELDKLSPVYPLTKIIRSFGYGDAEQVMVCEPDVISRLNEVYTD